MDPSSVRHRIAAPVVVPAPLMAGAATPRVRTRQAGFTLIEVLIALIVLVLGVLGAAAMTLTSLRDGKQSGLRSQAAALAYEIGDIMRANRNATGVEAIFTGTQPTGGISSCWTSSGCVPTDMATNDFYEWIQKLHNPITGLPNGQAVICHDLATPATSFPACDGSATSPLVVKLKWDEKNNNARGATSTTAVSTQYLVVTLQPF